MEDPESKKTVQVSEQPPGPQVETASDRVKRVNEQYAKEIIATEFSTLGYSQEALDQKKVFQSRFQQEISAAGGDPDRLIQNLKQKGISVVTNSGFLKGFQPIEKQLGGRGGPEALYATREILQDQLSAMVQRGETKSSEYAELVQVLSATETQGALFLGKNAQSKSKFHEAGHAIQQLSGLDMSAHDPETRLRRELEVGQSMLALADQDLLNGVTKGEYSEITIPMIGKTAVPVSGDVYGEVGYFNQNKGKLIEVQQQKKLTKVRKFLGFSI